MTTRIEVLRDRPQLSDDDTPPAERVNPPAQRSEVDGSRGGKRGDLATRMHARIGTPGAFEPNLFAENRLERPLERALDGRAVRLNLPAEVIGAVVLDNQGQPHHERRDEPEGSRSRDRPRLSNRLSAIATAGSAAPCLTLSPSAQRWSHRSSGPS
jgi:hypothetical protein